MCCNEVTHRGFERELFSRNNTLVFQLNFGIFNCDFQLCNNKILEKMMLDFGIASKTRSEKGRFSRRKTQKRKKAHAAFLDRKMRTRARVRAHTRAFRFWNEFVFRRVKIPERDFHAPSFFLPAVSTLFNSSCSRNSSFVFRFLFLISKQKRT